MKENEAKAKRWCLSQYTRVPSTQEGREWLTAGAVDSYGDSQYRVQCWVFEGSAAKGIVLSNYGTKTVVAFNAFGKMRRFK